MSVLKEDGVAMVGGTPANNVAGGAIAGLGVEHPTLPKQAEPGVGKKKRNLVSFKMFKRRLPE
jgi:hypothetical protein